MKDNKGRPVIRTPDERFENLESYPFKPNYIEIDGLRMHYVDEGPKDGEIVLMLHGEPSWSYLYRKMIPIVAAAGFRVIAPDLIGFGKSDKFTKRSDYSYQFHVDMMTNFVEKLGLNNINLFCQDWGGLIGLRLATSIGDRFTRVIAGNTTIPTLFPPNHKNLSFNNKFIPYFKNLCGFGQWYIFSQLVPKFNAGAILNMATTSKLTKAIYKGYNAPFPDKRYLAGARVFPRLVASQPKEGIKAWEIISKWEKPFLTVFSDKDPILGAMGIYFQKIVPGAKGINHPFIKNAGHFLQEDKAEELANYTIEFIKNGNVKIID